MRKILLQRLLQAVLMAWSVGTLTFIITRSLPGDMAYKIAAGRYGDDAVSTSAANAVAEELGLHRSAFEQYVSWMTDLASLDLGKAWSRGPPLLLSYKISFLTPLFSLDSLFWYPINCVSSGIYSGIRSARKSENTPKNRASLLIKQYYVFRSCALNRLLLGANSHLYFCTRAQMATGCGLFRLCLYHITCNDLRVKRLYQTA